MFFRTFQYNLNQAGTRHDRGTHFVHMQDVSSCVYHRNKSLSVTPVFYVDVNRDAMTPELHTLFAKVFEKDKALTINLSGVSVPRLALRTHSRTRVHVYQ